MTWLSAVHFSAVGPSTAQACSSSCHHCTWAPPTLTCIPVSLQRCTAAMISRRSVPELSASASAAPTPPSGEKSRQRFSTTGRMVASRDGCRNALRTSSMCTVFLVASPSLVSQRRGWKVEPSAKLVTSSRLSRHRSYSTLVAAHCVSCSFCAALRDRPAGGGAGGGGDGGGMRRCTARAVRLKSAEKSGWGSRPSASLASASLYRHAARSPCHGPAPSSRHDRRSCSSASAYSNAHR
mmetsp:Transcript_27291/g.43826  ORF Transcript_27291/g.43826 Transcript_27291/m.43826 type:complete len:238 (-) Transcript_27291:272-985(-)